MLVSNSCVKRQNNINMQVSENSKNSYSSQNKDNKRTQSPAFTGKKVDKELLKAYGSIAALVGLGIVSVIVFAKTRVKDYYTFGEIVTSKYQKKPEEDKLK